MGDSLTPEPAPSGPLYARVSAEPPAVGTERGPGGLPGPQTGAESLDGLSMSEEQRDDLIDLLPTGMRIWDDESEIGHLHSPQGAAQWWHDMLGHTRAHRGCCKACGCATTCLLAAFHDALIATVVRELDRLGVLHQPAPACSGTDGLCDAHGFHRHAPAPDGDQFAELREQTTAALLALLIAKGYDPHDPDVDHAQFDRETDEVVDHILPVFTGHMVRVTGGLHAKAIELERKIQALAASADQDPAPDGLRDLYAAAIREWHGDWTKDTFADQIRADVQRDRDRLAATEERVRRLAERWENALTPDRPYARALRNALTPKDPS